MGASPRWLCSFTNPECPSYSGLHTREGARATNVLARLRHLTAALYSWGMGYSLSEAAWPLVKLRFSARLTPAEADAYWADMGDLLARAEPHVLLVNATDMLMPEASFIRQQLRWTDEHRNAIVSHIRGVAFVLPSAIGRGVLRALQHFQPLPVAHQVFGSEEQALAWALSRL